MILFTSFHCKAEPGSMYACFFNQHQEQMENRCVLVFAGIVYGNIQEQQKIQWSRTGQFGKRGGLIGRGG